MLEVTGSLGELGWQNLRWAESSVVDSTVKFQAEAAGDDEARTVPWTWRKQCSRNLSKALQKTLL